MLIHYKFNSIYVREGHVLIHHSVDNIIDILLCVAYTDSLYFLFVFIFMFPCSVSSSFGERDVTLEVNHGEHLKSILYSFRYSKLMVKCN